MIPENFEGLFTVSAETGCHVWDGDTDNYGYGRLSDRGKRPRAHRIIWERHFGPIPNKIQVCHSCDNPPCVNIDHLFLGTNLTNSHDRDQKDRVMHGVKHVNAKLTEDDVRFIREYDRTNPGRRKHLSERFSIGRTHIDKIIWNKSWKRLKA